ncbi:MAG TPA: XRE family transcriptional regulator [Acidimicrobiales bacterium]|nr:XRE family transcriptional regulator [Acidimicrobiales bacterium]
MGEITTGGKKGGPLDPAAPAMTSPPGSGDRLRLAAERATSDYVGARLRARREDRGVSLRQFARELDVSASFVSQIETGKAKPSVATLYSICAALDMSIDELFATPTAPIDDSSAGDKPAESFGGVRDVLLRGWSADGENRNLRAPLVSRSERRALVLDSGVTWERLTATNHAESDFMFVRYDVGGSSTNDGRLIRHAGTEYGYVISGVLELTLGFETYRLTAGDSISFDSETPHRLTNVGDAPVEAIWFDQHHSHAHE